MTCSVCEKEISIGDLYCPHCKSGFRPKGKVRPGRVMELHKVAVGLFAILAVGAIVISFMLRSPLGGALNGVWVSEPVFHAATHGVVHVYEFDRVWLTRSLRFPEGTELSPVQLRLSENSEFDFRISTRRNVLTYGGSSSTFYRESADVIIIDGLRFYRQT